MPGPPENDPCTVENFTGLVDTLFTVELNDAGMVEIALVEVRNHSRPATDTTLPDGSPAVKRTPFSLTFIGPKTPLLPQRLYPVTHPEIGRHDLFLKPFFENTRAIYYEIVFN